MVLFFATLLSVFTMYGFSWSGGNPYTDPEVARDSALFAITLMATLLAHEMGHYRVARAHGFELSMPYFIPFPAAFGTFGAIIRLRSMPRSRTALLEMGAAGPLAGFLVALLAIALGLPGTVEHAVPQVLWTPPPEVIPEPGPISRALEAIFSLPPLSWLVPESTPGTLPLLILANPPAMDLLGWLILGAPPGRYAELGPVATAGWVGCLLTGINMLPIGQLDGGHVLNALAPRLARPVARFGVFAALVAGIFWSSWLVWGLLLLALGAWVSLPVPERPPPTRRAQFVAFLALLAFLASFMPVPFEIEELPLDQIEWVDESGARVELPPGVLGARALEP